MLHRIVLGLLLLAAVPAKGQLETKCVGVHDFLLLSMRNAAEVLRECAEKWVPPTFYGAARLRHRNAVTSPA